MNAATRFRCPACGFTVFNRRLSVCERCQAPLPDALRFTPEQLALLAAEAEANERTRRELAREAEEIERKKEAGRRGGG